MQHMFWLVEGQIAGRSGPNLNPWNISELKTAGIGAIISVNNGDACDQALIAAAGIRYQCIGLPDSIPPTPQDLESAVAQLPAIMAFISQAQADGLPVLIHCRSGRDRTCLVMAQYLIQQGAAPVHAISQVRAVRDIAFSSEGWDQFTFDVIYQLQ
ncbi:dual specificity protein phosphatase family protein [Shewanella sp. NIFS-20-20]|uniref:phosphatase domain-containing protein n=1 Tax=Shewanella sp. NIFS-20-20 TaxID=2853806 RepID=UPI001C4894AB|nr:dual specificity protein phosphatase family protein [Shewanella sp. NIFS-20-20]MBV7314974.1 dual specificity protein phosphatase family protein [Shewanella sp. NIFS-20-20]